jgi:hypothetical protein
MAYKEIGQGGTRRVCMAAIYPRLPRRSRRTALSRGVGGPPGDPLLAPRDRLAVSGGGRRAAGAWSARPRGCGSTTACSSAMRRSPVLALSLCRRSSYPGTAIGRPQSAERRLRAGRADLNIAYPRDRISSAKLLALVHLRLAFGSPPYWEIAPGEEPE